MPRLINRIAHYALTADVKGTRTVSAEHLEHARGAAAVNLPYLPVTHELSDEAAAQLSELLNDLAVAFDGQYCAQIIRYYASVAERCSCQNQLELFVDDNDAF